MPVPAAVLSWCYDIACGVSWLCCMYRPHHVRTYLACKPTGVFLKVSVLAEVPEGQNFITDAGGRESREEKKVEVGRRGEERRGDIFLFVFFSLRCR